MLGESESRSAAAPAAAGAARRLAFSLALALLSTTMPAPAGALSPGMALWPLAYQPLHRNVTCDGVPSPFGVGQRALLPGFEVTCGPNNEALLPVGDHAYRINAVSVPESYVIIFAGPLWQVCYDRSGRPAPARVAGATGPVMNLEGTPFTFSKRNRLVNVGCNYNLIVNFTNPPGDPCHWPYASCTTSCSGRSDTIINGSCNGEACCETCIPDRVNGAQAFNLSFDRTAGKPTAEEDGTCSAAFFLFKDDQVFTAGDEERTLKDALSPVDERRMVLDWAIGRGTCDEVMNDNFATPYCNNMSICVDAPSAAGYLCQCRSGYEGSPYLPDGCQDINECREPSSNNCTFQQFCNNIPGSYTCSCPEDKIGDGYRTGTGCTDTLVPSGSPKQLPGYPSGSRVCTMSGDGRKVDNGCQKQFPLDTALGVGLALMITITTAVSCYCWAMKKREVGRKRAELFRKNGGLLLQQRFSVITSQGEVLSAKIFSAGELKIATNNYSEDLVLGRGGHGTVYKGILPDKIVVAIKKSKVFDERQVEQFVNEITILSQIDHPNVVKLMGCCLETEVPLLVYEFIPNGTLFQQIHNRNVPCTLKWEDCLRIAAEVAEALAYLHSTSSIPIIHRDIKSSNILLDENFVAKISDFGASRPVPFDQTHITTLIQGTIGYLDPEYFQSSQLTQKSDVYSFGVVLAELLTRQKPISVARPEESCNLAMHLVVLFNEGRLLEEIEPHILAEAGEEQLYAVAKLAVRCLNLKGEERPSMVEVASFLHELKRSFSMEQTIRERDDLVQKNNEQEEEHLVHEIRQISWLHSSEISAQRSMDAEILSSHMPDDVPATVDIQCTL